VNKLSKFTVFVITKVAAKPVSSCCRGQFRVTSTITGDLIITGAFDSGAAAIQFRRQKDQSKVYSVLPLIARDCLSARVLWDFVKRLVSVCDILMAGRRSNMDKLLKMSAWLKVNCELSDVDS